MLVLAKTTIKASIFATSRTQIRSAGGTTTGARPAFAAGAQIALSGGLTNLGAVFPTASRAG